MARFLVTGVAGFIGRSIAAALLARGESVRGIDSFITGKRENLIGLEAMEFVEGDLADPAVCAKACEGVEVVFHEAALASVPRSVADPVATNVNCVDATLNLLVAAKAAGVRRVVYAGSSSAYGDTPTLPKREDMLPNPISPYAVAKLAGEHYMRAFTAGVWPGDGDAALLQRVWPVSGSDFALFGGAGDFLPAHAGRGTAHDLWRRRAEPRLHLHRQRGSRQSAGSRSSGGEGIRADDEHGHSHASHAESDVRDAAGTDRVSRARRLMRRREREIFATHWRTSDLPASCWGMSRSWISGRE